MVQMGGVNYKPVPLFDLVTEVRDVSGDGNCGLRALALAVVEDENAWPYIRQRMIAHL